MKTSTWWCDMKTLLTFHVHFRIPDAIWDAADDNDLDTMVDAIRDNLDLQPIICQHLDEMMMTENLEVEVTE